MRFYEISYRDESAADGFRRHFCTSKRGAELLLAELRRDYAEELKRAQGKMEAGEVYPAFPVFHPEEASISTVNVPAGTKRQMVLWALNNGDR